MSNFSVSTSNLKRGAGILNLTSTVCLSLAVTLVDVLVERGVIGQLLVLHLAFERVDRRPWP